MSIRFGMNAVLARNTGTWASPAWNEITSIRDVTLSLETATADVTTRQNNGWRATAATLKDASIEFEMIWDTSSDDFTAIRDAFLNNTKIDIGAFDGPLVSGTQGLHAECMVTSFSRSEPLEDAIKISVKLQPTYSDNAPEWVTL